MATPTKRLPGSRWGGKSKDKPDYTARTNTRNQNQLARLADEGLLEEFLAYKDKPSLTDRAKGFGSGVLDVISRSSYATGGVMDEVWGGDEGISTEEAIRAAKRAGREMFSGVGGLKGDKESIPEVIRKKAPQYGAWTEEHPIKAMASDLALDVALDPATYMGAPIIKGAGKLIGKTSKAGAKVLRSTKAGDQMLNKLGNSLIPRYGLKKGANKVAAGLGKKADDIVWETEQAAAHVGRELGRGMQPATKVLRSKEAVKNPQLVRDVIESVMPSNAAIDITRKADFDKVQDVSNTIRTTLGEMADIEVDAGVLGTKMDNYFPNNPKQVSDKYIGSGRGGGQLMQTKSGEQKLKKFRTADELVNWLKAQKIPDEKLGEVAADLLDGRITKTVSKLRSKNIVDRLTTELPEVFEKTSAKHGWDLKDGLPVVKTGNTLYMPSGNLRFFQTDVLQSAPKQVLEVLENGGEVSPEVASWIFNKMSETKMLGVTGNVPVFQAPIEVVGWINDYSRRLSEPDTMMDWWDSGMNVWKNMAILSPFFHMRNMVSSASQNYLAGMNAARYSDAGRFLYHVQRGNKSAKIMGKTVGKWADEMGKFGIDAGGFVGQQVGASNIPVVGKIFKGNRLVGTQVETLNRAALFMDRVQKGKSPLEAALDVKKFHFDYSELTNFEQKTLRRIMPFYSWTRHNVPLQLEMVFKAPNKYRNIAKLKRSVAGAPESEGNPEWWRKQDVWEIRGTDLAAHVGLPYTDLNFDSPMGMTGPIKTGINMMQNHDDFFNREISSYKGDRAMMEYAVAGFLPVAKRYGFDMSKHVREYLDPATPADKREAKYQLIKKFIGVGLIPHTKNQQDKNKIYQMREMLDEYNAKMKDMGE